MTSGKRQLLSHLLALIFLAIPIALLYSNTYQVPFYFDDMPNIVLNPYVRIKNLSWEGFAQVASLSPNNRRWLPNITYALNYYLGGYSVWGFHLVNIITHIATAFMLYLVGHLTLGLPTIRKKIKPEAGIAFAAALLWALHPLQTNAVTYIAQRMTSMAALFSLVALYFYVKARLLQASATMLFFFGLVALFAGMAILSKENAGMLPVIIVAYEFLLLRDRQTPLEKNKKNLLLIICVFLIFILICWLFLGNNPFAAILGGYEGRKFTLGQRLLSEARIVLHYLSLLWLPLPGRLNLFYDYTLSTGLLTPPQTLFSISVLVLLVLLIFRLKEQDRLFSFGICWLLINLIVESSFVPLELVFEHRMYLPSMFLFLAASAWIYRISASRPNWARLSLLLALALLSVATWQRNTTWGNSISFWSDVSVKSPNSMRAWGFLGQAYLEAKQFDNAEQSLKQALSLAESEGSGNFKSDSQGRKLHVGTIHGKLAVLYNERKQYQEAIKHANLAMTLNQQDPAPFFTLGSVYTQMGQYPEAYRWFQLAWIKGIRGVKFFNTWAFVANNLNRTDEAISLLHRALEIAPNNAATHFNLSAAYSSKGMLQEAEKELQRAIQLQQNH